MARPGMALRRARREGTLPRDPALERLVGELSERMESWEVLLYEVLDGRPIWDLATRSASAPGPHMRECGEAKEREDSCENLSQAPTQRGQATRELDSGPVPAHKLAKAYSTPAPKSSLQLKRIHDLCTNKHRLLLLDAGGSLGTRRHFQIKKDEISAGRTKNAARDWGFFSHFETPRADPDPERPTRVSSAVLPSSGAWKAKGIGGGDRGT